MSNKKEFIKNIFQLIKDNFIEFKDIKVKLDIMGFEEMEENEGVASTIYSSKTNDFTIKIMNDFYIFKREEPRDYQAIVDTNKEFFESINIKITEKSIIVATLLHEFGHLYHMIKFIKYSNIRNYIGMININREFQITAFNIDEGIKDESLKIDLYYEFMFNEIYAEMFKFKYFMKFWSIINNKALKGGNNNGKVC
jgi:hypothetical protein